MVTNYFEYYSMRDSKDISSLPIGTGTLTGLLKAFRGSNFSIFVQASQNVEVRNYLQ